MEYVLLLSLLYFAPTFLAARGWGWSVFAVNFFFGWTLLGWVVALVMAIRSRERVKEVRHYE